ncbi:SRF-TF domain-containing protein [Cephalotus follicularis]|uniref:SRF-TF domain-containing protein n=1 Tax=Cephalotus follicularis TaxID=3775 RepID=A0A1Q3AS34_CEPFO|nr:SRF-TF domain-containing protein [Cephalotus follicularis]
MSEKKSRGKQKIEMKKIENEDEKLITFSKRKAGIYKKASELVTLCGAEIFIGIFSPSDKPFTFSHPSANSIANRFLGQIPPPNDYTQNILEARRQIRINELNQRYDELLRQTEAEKESSKASKQLMRDKESQGWWEATIEKLNQQELEHIDTLFEDMKMNILSKISEKNVCGSSSSHPAMGINPLESAGPSPSSHPTMNFVQGSDPVNPISSIGASSSSQPLMDPSSERTNTFGVNTIGTDQEEPTSYDFGPNNL